MTATIISIGNSQGIRIPKPILKASGLGSEVELTVKKGEIRITPAKKHTNEMALLSENVLQADWDRPEEDLAWESLQ